MRTLGCVLLILALSPVAAPGKGVVAGKACGARGCTDIGKAGARLMARQQAVAPRVDREPFLRLRFVVGPPEHRGVIRLWALPGSGLVRGDGDGTWMAALAPGRLRSLAREIGTLPAARLPADLVVPPSAEVPPAPAPECGAPGGTPWWLALVALPVVAVPLGLARVLARRRRRSALPAG